MTATIPPAWAALAASLLLSNTLPADDPPPRDAARAAMAAQDWPGTIAAWGRAIAEDPSNVEARLGRGEAEATNSPRPSPTTPRRSASTRPT